MIRGGLARTWTDFKRHPWLHAFSIFTISAALFLLGFFGICYRNFNCIAEKTNPQLTGTAYLKDGIQERQIQAIREQILGMAGVDRVSFKSRVSVMQDLVTFVGGTEPQSLSEGEIFPNILEIEFSKGTQTDSILALKEVIAALPEVSSADFSEDWLIQYRKIRHFLRIFGSILMVGIFLGCSFVIANFMGMRLQSRKNEMEILHLIGAHRSFAFGPLFWEGLVEGVSGAFLALSGLFLLRTVLSLALTSRGTSMLGIQEVVYLSFVQILVMGAVGVAMAFLGSFTVFIKFQGR